MKIYRVDIVGDGWFEIDEHYLSKSSAEERVNHLKEIYLNTFKEISKHGLKLRKESYEITKIKVKE